jgi:hypothetical protein
VDTGEIIRLMVGVIYDMSIVLLFITLLSLIIHTRGYSIVVVPLVVASDL